MGKKYKELSPEEVQRRVLNTIVEDPMMVFALKSKYITDDIWIYCLQREPSIFNDIEHPSFNVCVNALNEDGMNIKKLKKKGVRITPELAYVAIRSTPEAILHVPPRFVPEELKEWAFDQVPSLMYHFRHNIREEYIERKIKENPSVIQYLWCPKDAWLELALEEDPNVVAYIPHLSERIKNFLKERYPDWYILITNREQEVES